MRSAVGTAAVERVDVACATVPTDRPEADGTLAWDATTVVVVRAHADGRTGLGWTYAPDAAGTLVARALRPLVEGRGALDVPRTWELLRHEVRNMGRPGVVSCALSAIDVALWDLKARLLDLSLPDLWGSLRDDVPAYGSGGFTSYDLGQLRAQLGGWARAGFAAVKLKVGADDAADPARVRAARDAVGPDVALFVDANGAWTPKVALRRAEELAPLGVEWLEEPVTSDDLEGLRLVRARGPAGVAVAAGEYGYDLPYFRRLLAADAVDVLQADATRCGGYTAFLRVAALCEAHALPLSAHTAPHLHAPVCVAAPRVEHVEYFHDHARIEQRLLLGAEPPRDGRLHPDRARPGHGLELDEDQLGRWGGVAA